MDELRRGLHDLAHSVDAPPPPDLSTLHGADDETPEARHGFTRPLMAAAAVVAIVAAGATTARLLDDAPAGDPAASWRAAGVPFLAYDGGTVTVRFGAGAYAVDSASRNADADPRVAAVAATEDSALAAVAAPGQNTPTTLVEVPADGPAYTVAEDAYGMALADPRGHLAAWTEPITDETWRVVAYDTDRREFAGTLEVPAGSSVEAVDGRQVFLYVEGDDPNGVWSVDAGPRITPLPGEIPGDKFVLDASADGGYLMVVDTGTVLYDPSGHVVHEFGADLFGTFDPDGTWVALVSPDPADGAYRVHEVATGKEVGLDLPDGVSPLSFRWSPDGGLVVKSFTDSDGDGEGTVRYDSCAVPEGGCAKLGELPVEVAERFDSSAWGQAMLTGPSD